MGIAAMNASFKFNRSQLSSKKKKKFAHIPGKYGDVKKRKVRPRGTETTGA